MAINAKLWELGNDVVKLRQHFEKIFPPSYLTGKNEIGECFNSLLELMNDIRLAIQEGDDPKKWYLITLNCKSEEIKNIKEVFDRNGFDFTIESVCKEEKIKVQS